MAQLDNIQQTAAIPEAAQTTETKVSQEVKALAQSYFDLNRQANDAKKAADKARKDLYAAMFEANLNTIEVSGGFIDRFAKESTVIDSLKIKDHLSPEQFWDAASFTKTAVKKYVPEAIIDKCSEVKTSKEDVHIRKK